MQSSPAKPQIPRLAQAVAQDDPALWENSIQLYAARLSGDRSVLAYSLTSQHPSLKDIPDHALFVVVRLAQAAVRVSAARQHMA